MAGKKSPRSALHTIYKRDGGVCHYCDVPVFLPPRHGSPMDNHPQRASRDHVIPRYYGGESHPRNYVLACAKCNSDRNHDLVVCECKRCCGLYEAAFNNPVFVKKYMLEMYKFNKPKIKCYRGEWRLYLHGKNTKFDSWEAALAVALNDETIKEKTNG